MMRMKPISLIALAVLLAVPVAYAAVQYRSFTLEAPHGQVIIEWITEQESGCTSFAVERSTDGVEFFEIATFTPHGAGEPYRYIDSDVFKQTNRTFRYRIRGDIGEQHVYSQTKSISISINTVQQTWGSLKALFR
ncbi:MAG: hypothetical protein MAG453_00625 [Calditrichaeota bacterium]|nr:hypothetical protein [Calditrichota bacterium]